MSERTDKAREKLIEYIEELLLDKNDVSLARLQYEPLLHDFERELSYDVEDKVAGENYNEGYQDARREYESSGYDEGYEAGKQDAELEIRNYPDDK